MKIKMAIEEEHRLISSGLIMQDNDLLQKNYGSKKQAEERLHQLEHKLNYGSLKGYKDFSNAMN